MIRPIFTVSFSAIFISFAVSGEEAPPAGVAPSNSVIGVTDGGYGADAAVSRDGAAGISDASIADGPIFDGGSDASTDYVPTRYVSLSPGPEWKILSIFSGKKSYYTIIEEDGEKLIRAKYNPDLDTVIFYRKLYQSKPYTILKWKWRVHKFPINADELVPGRMDSAAAVYVYFQSGLRKYVIKYIWSTAYSRGKNWLTGDSNYFNKLQVSVKEGPPPVTGEWISEEANISDDFRRFFLKGKDEEIPPVVGVGVLTDGDGTMSFVEADYADFLLGQ